VTLDGDLVERSGAIIGGFYNKTSGKVFSETVDTAPYIQKKEQIEKEMRILAEEIVKLNNEFNAISAQEQSGTKEVTEMQKESEEADKNYETLKSRRKELFDQKMNAQEEINRVRIKKARLEAELDNLKQEFSNYKKVETYEMTAVMLESKIRDTVSAITHLVHST
jgi:chromosome segregation protein